MWGALSNERTGLSFTNAPGPCQRSHFRLRLSRGTRDHILLSQIRDFPFRRLLWLTGLRWRYSTPPPHGIDFNFLIHPTNYLCINMFNIAGTWVNLQTHIIITIGKTALFEPQPSLEYSVRLHPGFTLLDFATVFSLHSKLVSLASNPQPGGPGPYIYVPHWQGGPVIPPGTGLPFRRLPWLAGLRWRYSNPPPESNVDPYRERNL
jgi:hypothetical protein